MTAIVKVQTQLFPKPKPGELAFALIYDLGRRHVRQRLLSAAEMARMNDRPRVFFRAQLIERDWVLGDEVPDPGWPR